MDIPDRILKVFNLFKPAGVIPPIPVVEVEKDECPVRCDPSRSKLAISKTGNKDKGRFVKVYYRYNRKKVIISSSINNNLFWRATDGLNERIPSTF